MSDISTKDIMAMSRLKIIVGFGLSCILVYYSSRSLEKYLEKNISVSVHRERIEKLQFPSFTVCSNFRQGITAAKFREYLKSGDTVTLSDMKKFSYDGNDFIARVATTARDTRGFNLGRYAPINGMKESV